MAIGYKSVLGGGGGGATEMELDWANAYELTYSSNLSKTFDPCVIYKTNKSNLSIKFTTSGNSYSHPLGVFNGVCIKCSSSMQITGSSGYSNWIVPVENSDNTPLYDLSDYIWISGGSTYTVQNEGLLVLTGGDLTINNKIINDSTSLVPVKSGDVIVTPSNYLAVIINRVH